MIRFGVIGAGRIGKALVTADVVAVAGEVSDLLLEIAGQIMVFERDGVF